MLKKIKIVWLIFLISFFWVKYTNAWNNELENKLEIILNKIIEKQLVNNDEYTTYENILNFSKQVKNIKSNDKVNSLINVLDKSLFNFEIKYFIKQDKILVKNINNPYIYYKWLKWYIYETDINQNIYKYLTPKSLSVCELENITKCIDYKWWVFMFDVNNKEFNTITKLDNNIIINKDWIYEKQLDHYYPETKNFLLWTANLKLIKNNINDNKFYFGWKYEDINNYNIYITSDNISYLWLYKNKKISDIILSNYVNINNDILLNAISRDARYLPNINNSEFINLYNDTKNLNTIQLAYNYVKNKLVYDYAVYDEYIQKWTVNPANYFVFTWIWSYLNNKWVCSWYVWLMQYILWINNIKNVKPVDWYYVDNESGELVPHSWLKINNLYYDPTFDDGLNWDNSWNNIYYGLSYNEMYIDRIDDNDIKNLDLLKSMSNNERKNYIKNNYLKNWKILNYNSNILLPYFIYSNIYNINNANDLSLSKLWDNTSKWYIFNISNWTITWDVFDKKWNKYSLSEIWLSTLTNIDQLTKLIQKWNVNKDFILWLDQLWNFYIVENIKFR